MIEPSAAVAILHARGLRESVLLIRRSEREGDSWSGHWSFPGGRRDPGDSDLLHTALRELAEECGIQLVREQMEAALAPMQARRRVGPFLLVAPFLFRVDAELPAVPDAREAVEAAWIPMSTLVDPTRHRLRSVPGVPAEILYPAIDLNGPPLWGFTYRLITEWLGLIPKQHPIEQAGLDAARDLLNLLFQYGLTLKSEWADRAAGKVAEVAGVIPVAQVLSHVSAPNRGIPRVGAVEVRPDHIRVLGLAFEEYFIYASS